MPLEDIEIISAVLAVSVIREGFGKISGSQRIFLRSAERPLS
jgi:hypothetical protein